MGYGFTMMFDYNQKDNFTTTDLNYSSSRLRDNSYVHNCYWVKLSVGSYPLNCNSESQYTPIHANTRQYTNKLLM